MSAFDKSPNLESNGNATGAEALKLLERVYPYIRHDPECPSTLDRGCECPVSILREQIEDLIATQHAPSVGPGNEAGAAICDSHKAGYELAPRATCPICELVEVRSELEQAREAAARLKRAELNSNKLYTALRENRPMPEELKGTGLAIEVQSLIDGRKFYEDRVSSLREAIEQKDNALENAGNALKICYADSHAIRTEWLRENNLDSIANVVDNIQRWSGSHHNEIRLALLLSKKAGDSPAVSVSSEDPPATSPRPEQTCVECGRGIGQLHKPKCSHTGRFLCEKEADVSADTELPTEVQEN